MVPLPILSQSIEVFIEVTRFALKALAFIMAFWMAGDFERAAILSTIIFIVGSILPMSPLLFLLANLAAYPAGTELNPMVMPEVIWVPIVVMVLDCVADA